jgi:hypothetical protein
VSIINARRPARQPGEEWTGDGGSSQEPTEVSRGPRWSRRHLERAGVFAVLAVMLAVQLVNVGGWPYFTSDDEGTYYAQAWAVLQGQMAHYTYWYDHPPGGWIQLAPVIGLLSLIPELSTATGGRVAQTLWGTTSAWLIYRLCKNLNVSHWGSLVAVLVWGLCPLVVFWNRRLLLDNLALPWILAALVLATVPSRRLMLHLAAGACYGVAILTKETSLLAAPAIVVALWHYSYKPTRWFSMVGAITLGGLVVSLYALEAALKSELLPGPGHVSITTAVQWQLSDRQGSGSVLDPNSLARRLVNGWLHEDWRLLALGLVFGAVCLFSARLRLVGVLLLTYGVVTMRPDGYLPEMIIITILPFCAIAAVAVIDALPRLSSRVRLRQAGAVVTAAATVAGLGWLGNSWAAGDRSALTLNDNASYHQALDYVSENLPRDTVILTDDVFWNDLVKAGWSGDGWSGPIWYYKIDRDPLAQQKYLPGGWRQVDYVLTGRPMAGLIENSTISPTTDPKVMAAYHHSSVVQQWGEGNLAIQLRKVDQDAQVEPGRDAYPPPVIHDSVSDGQYSVGRNIVAGTYRTTTATSSCFWATLSDVGRETRNKSGYGKKGTITVQVTGKDEAFLTDGCGTWTKTS